PLAIERSSKEIIALFESRKNFYEECAKMTIDTTNRSPEEIINEILQQLKE
ncbi:TPA: shikimate kinase, partial [Enterococcus faecalis]|nr:shikimate kinase [Enterococcus faecalis]